MTSVSVLDTGVGAVLRSFLFPAKGQSCRTVHAAKSPQVAKDTKFTHVHDNSVKPTPDSAAGKSLARVYGGKYEKWLRSYGVMPSWETNSDSVEIHLWHGYRPNPSPMSYLLKSAFYPTNEALNIWTHFIPFLLMVYRTYCIFTSLQHPTDLIYWPFWVHSFGCCYVLVVSSFAHMFNSKSARSQEFCMCFDYSAICSYGISNLIAYELYVYPHKCLIDLGVNRFGYIFLSLLVGYFVQFFSCISRHHRCPNRHFIRFTPTALCYLFISIPIAIKFLVGVFGGPYAANPQDEMVCSLGSEKFASTFAIHTMMYVGAGVSAFSRFPEKYYPGWFDIFGHSHQFFHLFIALGLYTQNLLVEHVLRDITPLYESGRLSAEAMAISEWTTLYPMAIFVSICFCIAFKFSKFLADIIQERRNKLA